MHFCVSIKDINWKVWSFFTLYTPYTCNFHPCTLQSLSLDCSLTNGGLPYQDVGLSDSFPKFFNESKYLFSSNRRLAISGVRNSGYLASDFHEDLLGFGALKTYQALEHWHFHHPLSLHVQLKVT